MVKVFLAIEDQKVLSVFKRQFESLGFKVDIAQKMSVLRALLKESQPHVVISQASGPEIDGFEVARLIDKKSDFPKIILLKNDEEHLDPVELMKLRIDKVILNSGIDKMVSELSALQGMGKAGAQKSGKSHIVGAAQAKSPALKVIPGRDKKYAQIIQKHDTSGAYEKRSFSSSEISKATAEIKKSIKLDPENEDLRVKFAEALYTLGIEG